MGTSIKLGLGFKVEAFMFFAFLDQPVMMFPFLQKLEAHMKLMMLSMIMH
jgi:hypothetical protein